MHTHLYIYVYIYLIYFRDLCCTVYNNKLPVMMDMTGMGIVQSSKWSEIGEHEVSTRDSKVHGANMGPNWGRPDPGGPRVGPMNLANWDVIGHVTQHSSWIVDLDFSILSRCP